MTLSTKPKDSKKPEKSNTSNNSNSDTKSESGKNDVWWWKGGFCLYVDQNDLDKMNSASNNSMDMNFQNSLFSTGQEEGSDSNSEDLEEQISLTLPMQETIAMSFM